MDSQYDEVLNVIQRYRCQIKEARAEDRLKVLDGICHEVIRRSQDVAIYAETIHSLRLTESSIITGRAWQNFVGLADTAKTIKDQSRCKLRSLAMVTAHWGLDLVLYYGWHRRPKQFLLTARAVAQAFPQWEDAVQYINIVMLCRHKMALVKGGKFITVGSHNGNEDRTAICRNAPILRHDLMYAANLSKESVLLGDWEVSRTDVNNDAWRTTISDWLTRTPDAIMLTANSTLAPTQVSALLSYDKFGLLIPEACAEGPKPKRTALQRGMHRGLYNKSPLLVLSQPTALSRPMQVAQLNPYPTPPSSGAGKDAPLLHSHDEIRMPRRTVILQNMNSENGDLAVDCEQAHATQVNSEAVSREQSQQADSEEGQSGSEREQIGREQGQVGSDQYCRNGEQEHAEREWVCQAESEQTARESCIELPESEQASATCLHVQRDEISAAGAQEASAALSLSAAINGEGSQQLPGYKLHPDSGHVINAIGRRGPRKRRHSGIAPCTYKRRDYSQDSGLGSGECNERLCRKDDPSKSIADMHDRIWTL